MNKNILITIASILLCFSSNAQQKSENFYYYRGEKIYLQQTDKIYLKFVPDTNAEQIRSLICKDSSLLTSKLSLDNNSLRFAVVESKGSRNVSSTDIEAYKASSEVVSANFMFQNEEQLSAITDEFVVKLKATTSYNQLQDLAEENDCKIERENEFIKNKFVVNVSKMSNLNALQMSNLFYETGLFDYSSLNFVLFNIFQSNDTYFIRACFVF